MRVTDPELHERRREEILAAAESCFVKSGFHAASMQQIAKAAGVSLGLLYRYFANKEAIVGQFVELDLGTATAAIDEWGRSADPLHAFRRMMLAKLREAREPARAAIEAEIYAEALRNDPLRWQLGRHEAGILKAWVMAIQAQQAAGRIGADINAPLAAELILTIIEGSATRRLLQGRRGQVAPDEIILARLLELVGLWKPAT